MSLLLKMQGVSFNHGHVALLRDFSLLMERGEQRLLLGPSGSGKSTLINLVCGFLQPQSGTIHVAGKAISTVSEARRDAVRKHHVAVIFQSLRLVSAIDVKANLELAARLAGKPVARAEIEQLLDTLGIADRMTARIGDLSQGEAQRVAIARALIVKPDLLIADEPTSALDHRNADIVAHLLMQISRENGTGLLVATHDTRLKPYFAQSLLLGGADAFV